MYNALVIVTLVLLIVGWTLNIAARKIKDQPKRKNTMMLRLVFLRLLLS